MRSDTQGRIDKSTILWVYNAYSKQLIHQYKYLGVTRLEKTLETLIIKNLERINFSSTAEAILTTPLHWRKRAERGFNQTDIIARTISKLLNIPIISAIKRIKYKKAQAHNSQEERISGYSHDFKLIRPVPKKILLVDDIITTATTITQIAKIIQETQPNTAIESFALMRANYRGAPIGAPQSNSNKK